jgi:hypothetical protein
VVAAAGSAGCSAAADVRREDQVRPAGTRRSAPTVGGRRQRPVQELLGFAFPKEERAALVAAEPDKFLMPIPSDERHNWVRVRLAAIDEDELAELVVDAWRMCVPKRVAAEFDRSRAGEAAED